MKKKIMVLLLSVVLVPLYGSCRFLQQQTDGFAE